MTGILKLQSQEIYLYCRLGQIFHNQKYLLGNGEWMPVQLNGLETK